MFAVITSPIFWKEIKDVITEELNSDVLFNEISTDIEIGPIMDRIANIPVKYLILDVSSISEKSNLIRSLRFYRVKRGDTRIIIISPNAKPGNQLLSQIVTLGIYDILTPDVQDDSSSNIGKAILEKIETPSTYSQAVRFDIGANMIQEEDTDEKEQFAPRMRTKTVVEKEIVEKTIFQDKLLGTGMIALAGTNSRVGTTHYAINISKFLSKLNMKVAVIELYPSEHFELIRKSYKELTEDANKFVLDNIHFYPYKLNPDLTNIMQEEYNYIILDMGVYANCNLTEFKRSQVKIIVSCAKDWELVGLQEILDSKDMYISKYKYLFNFCDDLTMQFIKENMDELNVYQGSYNPNPFEVNKGTAELYKSLLKEILPTQNIQGTGFRIPNIFKSKKKEE
jgi:hypothetical protein